MKKIVANDGHVLIRRSRWIKIRHNYNPSKRNGMWDYVRDGYGRGEGSRDFDPASGLYLDYFRWNGANWAIERFNSMYGTMGAPPIFFEDENGKTSYISGYDSENYYNPILIELDDCGEYVRVYEEA